MEIVNTIQYQNWIAEIKEKIRSSQIKAAISVNTEMLDLYWYIGLRISEKIAAADWGTKVVEALSEDLQREFPDFDGFSKRNLLLMKQWSDFYQSSDNEDIKIVKQVVSQLPVSSNGRPKPRQLIGLIPWGHNIVIVQKCKEIEKALFYVIKTLENNWSRSILVHQIEGGLYERQGKAISNFQISLPKPQSDLANDTLKDPYKFDFLNLTEKIKERDIENQLIKHMSQFLLELGTGFAFIAQQYILKIEDKDYKIDLLFYHIELRCFIVIELKSVEFEPDFTGKLSFYISAVDDLLKKETDNPTIGILLCKSKNKIEVEYALKGIKQPIGVAEYELCKAIPDNLKSQLPSIEDIENELNK